MTDKNIKYKSALDFLYSHIDLSITRNLHYSPEKFNLKRMREFMSLLGNPHMNYSIIHVAGTKGKGSTCAMLANILSKSGYRTGFYSSPHIIIFRERIQIDGKYITRDEVIELINKLKQAEKVISEISTFELITAMAFLFFSEMHVDAAVFEVGMGGRLDATNIVDPDLSIITSISMDHMRVLGDTIEKIAFEKCGIIKKGKPVVSSSQVSEVRKVIRDIAKKRESELVFSDFVYTQQITKRELSGQTFEIVKSPSGNQSKFHLPLIGDHQVTNALTVIATVEKLRELGWDIPNKAIEEGFRTVNWPGRLEILDDDPLLIVDGAHNPDSFEKLNDAIKMYFDGKRIILIFGASEDKEIKEMLRIISPITDKIIFTKANHPRAADIEVLEEIGNLLNLQYISTDNIESSMKIALQLASSENAIIAAGSLFVAGAVKSVYKKMNY